MWWEGHLIEKNQGLVRKDTEIAKATLGGTFAIKGENGTRTEGCMKIIFFLI